MLHRDCLYPLFWNKKTHELTPVLKQKTIHFTPVLKQIHIFVVDNK